MGSIKKNNKGFITLTLILLSGAVVLAIATGILLRAISDVRETADSENSLKAWSAVNACGEHALLQMIASSTSTTTTAVNWNYASTTGQELDDIGDSGNSCYIYRVTDSGTAKLIKASSTVASFTRKILIEVATNTPSLKINSWNYVADF